MRDWIVSDKHQIVLRMRNNAQTFVVKQRSSEFFKIPECIYGGIGDSISYPRIGKMLPNASMVEKTYTFVI